MRVGIVHYVNSRPLSRGLLAAGADDPLVCDLLPPASIADRLRSGALDVGLVPSIELARIPGLEVVPGLAIAATHEVRRRESDIVAVATTEIRPVPEIGGAEMQECLDGLIAQGEQMIALVAAERIVAPISVH